MESNEAAIVERVLEEKGLEAQDMLVALLRAIMQRHVDCELRKRGRRVVVGQERPDGLVPVMDALHEGRGRNAQTDPTLAGIQNTLFEMFTECQITAEAAAGLNQDDDDPPSHMRLVRD